MVAIALFECFSNGYINHFLIAKQFYQACKLFYSNNFKVPIMKGPCPPRTEVHNSDNNCG